MKTRQQIQERLAKVEADERKHYPPADVFSNAPLALIQVQLDTEASTLEWVLRELEADAPQQKGTP